MTHDWSPSPWGRRLSRSPDWRLRRVDDRFELTVEDELYSLPVSASTAWRVRRGPVWSTLSIATEDGDLRLGGLAAAPARELQALWAASAHAHQQDQRLDDANAALAQIRRWLDQVDAAQELADAQQRWFTLEQQQNLLEDRPHLSLDGDALWAIFDDPTLRLQLHGAPAAIEDDLQRWADDWETQWASRNDAHLQQEREAVAPLLAEVERRPLSEEQIRAVLSFESRMLLVAAAGSGKTSTMVAKAAYAVQRGLMAPDQIVMLAFNKEAATELQQRTAAAFERLGLPTGEVNACTFHALGRQIIGKVTGRMPEVPSWAVDAAQGFDQLADIIDRLKDRSLHFRTQWDMFRLVFARDLPPQGETTPADGWDSDGNRYVRSLRGERVGNIEECVIADWLFYNGVDYTYEPHPSLDTGTDIWQPGCADFFYPGTTLYHVHHADGRGDSSPSHARSSDAVQLRTTAAQLRSGELFDALAEALTAQRWELDPNPDRELPAEGAKPMPDSDLIGLLRTFISHAKSNGLAPADLAERLRELPEDRFKHRYRLFLELATPILHAWDDALAAENAIDFEDMLNQAAEYLEQGRYASPYRLVMADEFQDASRARARLCKALVQAPGRHLFAVGDDWQSINRFAGADVSVMTGFTETFGPSQVLQLSQTFRCPQALCDASSRFISKNPAQIAKQVRSATPAQGPVLQAFQVASRDRLQDAIYQYLQRLQQQLQSGAIAPGRNGRLSVFVLGRYNADRAYLPTHWAQRFGAQLELSFLTAHRAKGAEADIVILPSMLERSFPSARTDDPVLGLAMPHADTYPLSEERRLFYVALTRARRSVAMFTVQGKRSPFLTELVHDGAVEITATTGEPIREQACPVCDGGVIVQRSGPYGEFASCSGFPRCQYKPKQAAHATALR
ncbi:UvrD-helicase domain-containing protein [uncultured Stenotrophomonas sp.]|uniref:UvrD-helicase domain-containing protein n=1 Tax=uncultured Stenotrophomonas sp. TaxID=165438 RepID=UPI0028EA52B0|nr:UvrD-helicase domain-containing protein [uncultured Stenotrophomonas sp.]